MARSGCCARDWPKNKVGIEDSAARLRQISIGVYEKPAYYWSTTMNAVTLYNDIWSSTSALEARCKESLNPRGSDMLYDLFARFSPTAQSEVIDIGCRDASYAIELANRFGCRVLGIDPAPMHIERARKKPLRPGSQVGCALSWPGLRRCRWPTDRST